MRVRAGVLLAFAAATFGAGVVACFDLFHSTADVLTACQLDAQAPGCADAGTDFCAWSEPQALLNAQHACAWLGACEAPLGRNAFGSCMFEALLAYDCHANPNHPAKGKAQALWDCLWQAQSCSAVNACVFPQGSQSCEGGPYVVCASQGGVNADVRAECLADGGPPRGENCALWGQTCGGDLAEGVCAGSAGDGALDCTVTECAGSALHWCVDGGDVGLDCANNGAGACSGFPSTTAASWLACLPLSDAGACQPDASARCDNGVAVSCPAGVVESLDCQFLLQNAQGCTSGNLSPKFDWTSPCVVSGDAGDASACSESCSGTVLSSCYRGASFSVDCTNVGLGACAMVSTDLGTAQNAACAPSP